MLISDSHRFIFVHIRKAAGTSLRQILERVSLPKPANFFDKFLSRSGYGVEYHRFSFRKHDPLYKAEISMPPKLFGKYFKFAFVRNPWDRLVSEYEYIKTRPEHSRHRRVMGMSFRSFVAFQSRRPQAHQINMLVNCEGKLMCDFVGRFETLHADLAQLSDRIGLDCTQIPHINKLDKKPYQAYFDGELVDYVQKHWQADIRMFNYDFEENVDQADAIDLLR